MLNKGVVAAFTAAIPKDRSADLRVWRYITSWRSLRPPTKLKVQFRQIWLYFIVYYPLPSIIVLKVQAESGGARAGERGRVMRQADDFPQQELCRHCHAPHAMQTPV